MLLTSYGTPCTINITKNPSTRLQWYFYLKRTASLNKLSNLGDPTIIRKTQGYSAFQIGWHWQTGSRRAITILRN